MGLFSHKCSKCGAPCEWNTDGFTEGWWCRQCHERKKEKRDHKKLEERVIELERKLQERKENK